MDALHLHVAVAGRAVAVVERDGTHDPTTGRVLTGSWLWDSSLVLASHLAADASARLHLRSATVLELGARGTGLPGTRPSPASAPHAACSRTANAEANGLAAAQADDQLRVDVVLMSDVFYDPDMPAMAATLRGLWRDGAGGGGTVGWAASEVRDSMMDCMDVLREQGFEVDEVDRVTRPLLHDPDQTAAFAVYRVSLRQQEEGVDFDYSPSC
ncbi:hypothetical protein SETIT_7G261500v2 [Setaria italica]|uniref:Methyltransferase type 11 domain-containing protein n=1 Tax=Setaria italica TaxID=4555 RepID=A0A368RZS4_SETIT|nr:hypothetical protein SETIT_7G261500v2 [Setaria italica]